MTPSVALLLAGGALVGAGVYLLLARSVVRALMGFLLFSNGVNVLFLVASGPAGEVPVMGEGRGGPISDPVPQALMLTAIVITFAMMAFLLALAHRHWQVTGSDLVVDDPESSRIHQRAEEDDLSGERTADEEVQAVAGEFAEEAGDRQPNHPSGSGHRKSRSER